ncbi:hypothetical protein B0H12DRAFT_1221243 [Mycena haematopus]|nr:hypothetical protein B0H12DRAFT_1221243 [Mycena haematopus]
MEEIREVPYDHERCTNACLIPLSETCRWLRTQTLPWIFREVYNWSRNGVVVWPNALWGFFVTINLRDILVRHPARARLPLSPELFIALPMMQALTKATLRLEGAVPPELMSALSLIPNLSVLEIHQARFDGPFSPVDLLFLSLSSLLICICGFKGVTRVDGIDIATEKRNVAMLLHILSDRLTSLKISGDLMSPEFPTFCWPKLQEFTITEHTPTPFIPVPTLVAHMPALRVLSVLFTADMTRNTDDLFPPFTLGTVDGEVLNSPHLTSITLSNLEADDPIFRQLPASLESFHHLAMRDQYASLTWRPHELGEASLLPDRVSDVLDRLSHLDHLTELSLTFFMFVSVDVIDAIATKFPGLQSLQLGFAIAMSSAQAIDFVDFRPEAHMAALRRFQFLTHLKISFDVRWRDLDRGPLDNAAYHILNQLPGLQFVSLRWQHYYIATPAVWRTWDRGLLDRVPPPPLEYPSPQEFH